MAINRVTGRRLVDLWLQADLLGVLQQIGVVPPVGLAQVAAMALLGRERGSRT